MNGKQKGSGYERDICKRLSLWVSAGQHEDLFWRSAMSGGRATVGLKRGVSLRQAGDICSVSPEGHALTNVFYCECKFYKSLDIAGFFLTGTGNLAGFWRVAVKEASKHKREPMIIARQNRTPDLIILKPGAVKRLVDTKKLSGMVSLTKGKTPPAEVRFLADVLSVPFIGSPT